MKIVVMGGSFNPPTIAHLRLMQAAILAIGADKGIFVPSSDAYVRKKMTKLGQASQTLPESLRYGMLTEMVKTDLRLTVDDREFYITEKQYTYDTMCAIQEQYPNGTLYFLAGNDKLSILPRWGNIQCFLERFSIIVCRRDDENPEDVIEKTPFLLAHREHLNIIEAPDGIDGISATAVRNALERGGEEAAQMCHPDAWRVLMQYRDAVRCFREEYFFLSNFWEAPIEYGGLTYGNNEAAFQAQKCISREEMLPFTTMSPSQAKHAGRLVKLRPDWETVKVEIMEEIVRAKFSQNEDLRSLLLATGERRLEEGNHWHDTFWGVDIRTRNGKNHLGMILMKVRNELAAQP